MSRTGQFGRLPKSAPDLAATIVGLMREYQAQVDQNMVDAWQNGGKVDGKPVTDQRLIAHLTARRNELDKSDPQYQQWDNRILQYTFAIESSKMTVKWDNHQVTEGGMAAFFHKWEQKTPDNTEFDRTLRSAYGKWANAASSRGAAGAGRAKAAAHNADVMAIYKAQVAPGAQLNTDLVWLAQQTGIIPPGNSSNLADTQVSQDDIGQLLDMVSDGKAINPAWQPFVDAVTKDMTKVDPNFKWGVASFTAIFDKADRGLTQLGSKATTKTEAKQWSKMQVNLATTNNRVTSLPGISDVIAARKQLETDLHNAADDPSAQREIIKTYVTLAAGVYLRLTKGATPGNPSDFALVGPLGQEVDSLTRAINGETLKNMPPTIFDSSSGTTADSGQDAQSWVALVNGMNANAETIRNGGWAEPGVNPQTGKETYVFHPANEAAPAGAVAVPGGVTVDGVAVTIWVTPVPVTVGSMDPANRQPSGAVGVRTDANGQPLDASGATIPDINAKNAPKVVPDVNAGFSTLTFVGSMGDPVKLYMTVAADGSPVYTLAPPLIPGKAEIRTEGQRADGTGGHEVVIVSTSRDPVTGSTAPMYDPKQINAIASLPMGATGAVDISTVPGAFATLTGARLSATLAALDTHPASPTYQADRARTISDMQNASTTLLQQAATMAANGYPTEAASLQREASLVGGDIIKFHNAATNDYVLQMESWLGGSAGRAHDEAIHASADFARASWVPAEPVTTRSDWRGSAVDRLMGGGSSPFGLVSPLNDSGTSSPASGNDHALKLPTWGHPEPGGPTALKLATAPAVASGPGYHGFGGPAPGTLTPAPAPFSPYGAPTPAAKIAVPNTATAIPKPAALPPGTGSAAATPPIPTPPPMPTPPTTGKGPKLIPV